MIAAGILLAFCAAIATAFAIVLQASEAERAPASESARLALLVRLWHRPRWLFGTGLIVLAWPLQVIALALAPITVVQPVLASSQLVLLAAARVQLHEDVGRAGGLGALAIVAGVSIIVVTAPRHSSAEPSAVRLAVPMAIVGAGAVLAYLICRLRPPGGLLLVIGAGLAYAWVDFVNKLLSDASHTSHWALAAIWLVLILTIGGLAFLLENSALAERPAVTVGPVIGAIQDPLPVLMALWTGAEAWSSGPEAIAALAIGLTLTTAGAAMLGRHQAVARIAARASNTAAR